MDDTKVGLVYGPFYLAGQITVDSHLGVPAGTAKDLYITRHLRAKATDTGNGADTYPVKLSSGINYPDLAASRLSEPLNRGAYQHRRHPSGDITPPSREL